MLAILTTHPIQYQVPLWQALAREGRVPFEVWYLTRHAAAVSRDREFGQAFAWDLDMLSGYPHRFLDVDPSATPNTFLKCRVPTNFSELLHEAKAKAVWIQGWQVAAYWQAVWAAKKAGVEVWLRGESNDLAPTPFLKRVAKRVVLGQLFRRVDRFLYIGTANRRLYEKFGVPADRLYPAHYAVDNERFARQAEQIRNQRSEIRNHWCIPEDAFCLLFCGKFIPKKRPLDLIAAARSLITDHRSPNLHLLFAGSGELGAQLRANCNVVFDAESLNSSPKPALSEVERVTRHNSENRELMRPVAEATIQQRETKLGRLAPGSVTDNAKPPASFAGFLNQTAVSTAYVAADCLVMPSDYRETWGLVVNEAMASGLPCVISDQCGCAEDLGKINGNAVFRCGDVSELAEKICLMDESDRQVMPVELPSFSTTIATVTDLYV